MLIDSVRDVSECESCVWGSEASHDDCDECVGVKPVITDSTGSLRWTIAGLCGSVNNAAESISCWMGELAETLFSEVAVWAVEAHVFAPVVIHMFRRVRRVRLWCRVPLWCRCSLWYLWISTLSGRVARWMFRVRLWLSLMLVLGVWVRFGWRCRSRLLGWFPLICMARIRVGLLLGRCGLKVILVRRVWFWCRNVLFRFIGRVMLKCLR